MENYLQKQALFKRIVKATLLQLVILMVMTGVSLAHERLSQEVLDVKVTLDIRDRSLKDVLRVIESTVDVRFAYTKKAIETSEGVTIHVIDEKLSDVLDILLKPRNISYEAIGDQIILKQNEERKARPSTEEVSLNSKSAADVITGTVRDGEGESIPGVNIILKGTTVGTVTDVDGKYSLAVPDLTGTLVFSYIGYVSVEVPVNGRRLIDVALHEDVTNLEEVVVVGYGVQKKASVVGAIGSVQGEEILRSPTPNVTQSLAGRIPGLTAVQTSGKPGFNASQILVRGQATFGNASAIIIVDGIERSDFGNIDPNEIESINVLKDASATAIYGIRGANGVIVITTKKGLDAKPVVTYTGNFGLQSLTGMPRILNAYNSAFLKNEALFNDALPVWFTSEELQKFKDGSDPVWYPNVNWYEEITRDFFAQTQHNLNVRGGNDVAKYFVSMGYTFEDGMTKDYGTSFKGFRTVNNFKRYNFRSNIDLNLTKDLSLGVMMGGIFGKAYSPGNFHFGDIGFVLEKVMVIPSYAMPVEIPGVGYASAPSVGVNLLSPIGQLRGTSFQTNENNSIESTLNLRYKLDKIVKGLSFRGTYAYDSYSTNINRAHANPTVLYDILDRRNQVYAVSPIWRLENYSFDIQNNPNNGRINTNLQAGFEYNQSFGVHHVTGLVIANRQMRQSTGTDAVNALQGIASRVTYDYDNRYFLEINAGYNGSENFARANRYALFPSFAAGYNLTNEAFLSDVSWLYLLKIRGSYGIVGNDQMNSRFLFLNDYAVSGNVQFGDPNSIVNYPLTVHSRIGNPDVTWEKATKRNIGLEAGFGNGSLEVTVDIFDEHRRDILVSNPQSRLSHYGEAYPAINVGEVYNKGYEISISHHKTFGPVQFGLTGQLSFARNKILNIDEPIGLPDYQKRQGKRIGQFVGYLTDGFYQSEEDIAASPTNTLGVAIPGDLKFIDYNDDGQINPDDRVPIGYSNRPEYNYSMIPSITWKGFSLEVMFQGVANVSSNVILTENNAGQQMYDFMVNRWTPATAATATWPSLHSTGNSFISYNTNDFLLQDASYLKVRNAQLTWTLPHTVTDALQLSLLQLYLNGQNLYTWTPYRFGYDPELSGTRNYPTSRVYNLGVKVQF